MKGQMKYYPVFLNLEGKTAVVVGGGRVAQRKIETLLRYGALISLISSRLTDKLNELVEIGSVRYLGTDFQDKHLDEAFLVIAATDDKELNRHISKMARRRRLLVNVVDQPPDCNFILPSIVERGHLLIAISTAGRSPTLAKKIRKELESRFGSEYATFLLLMGQLRKEVLAKGFSQDKNNLIFYEIVNSGILDALREGDWKEVVSTLRRILPRDMETTIEDISTDIRHY